MFVRRRPWAAVAALLPVAFIALALGRIGPAARSDDIEENKYSKKDVSESVNEFVSADIVPRDAQNHVVKVPLEIGMTEFPIQKARVRLRCYNGHIAGPTIRARPGDRLEIRLHNAI